MPDWKPKFLHNQKTNCFRQIEHLVLELLRIIEPLIRLLWSKVPATKTYYKSAETNLQRHALFLYGPF